MVVGGENLGRNGFDAELRRMLSFEEIRTNVGVMLEAGRAEHAALAEFSAARAEEFTDDTFSSLGHGTLYPEHPSVDRLRRSYDALVFFFTNPLDFNDEPDEDVICELLDPLIGDRLDDEIDMALLADQFEMITTGLIVHSLLLEGRGKLRGMTYRERLAFVNQQILLRRKPPLDSA